MDNEEFESLVEKIRGNLDTVENRVRQSAEKANRDPDGIKIIAVTKLMPVDTIRAGIAAGIRDFGENYPEQAAEKILKLDADEDLRWHMIGHIQSRKTDTVCQLFQMVHSLDRMKIARYLDRYSSEMDKIMPVLIEVNLSGEESKYGWQAWDEDSWSDLADSLRKISGFNQIEIKGLMTMPPLSDDPETTRPVYKRLSRLQTFLRDALPDETWDELSIGTSFDYEVAIEEGATMVRIGTEIFGQRTYR